MCRDLYVNVVDSFSKYLVSQAFFLHARLSEKAFSRTGVLSFARLMACLLGGYTSKVQSELDAFFANLANRAELLRKVSAQAFAQARKQVSATAFGLLNDQFLTLVDEQFGFPLWNGLRVVAGDATVLRLTLFGKTRDGKSFARHVVDAIGFALYLPGIEMTLAAKLYSPDVGERQMLFEHLDKLRDNDILVLDRGYPAYWLFAALTQRGRHFCMRADSLNFGAVRTFRRSGLVEQIVTLPAPGKQDALDYEIAATPCKVRLIRQVFGQKVRVLVTSLLDRDAYPAHQFGALYHSRWRIEEAFRRIKHRLALEHLSGMSWLAAQQDFGAKVLCDNLNALAVHAASEALDPNTRARYFINRGDTFSRIKRTLGRWLLQGLDALDNVASVFNQLIKNLVQIKPNRSYPRDFTNKPHLSHAYKGSV
ncbi:MAG: IS4 family transposase [Accumulibacter sp.]|uniref:IS4 family transposase n=1 Tax=Accumulibacter sp. TaxID=2053492 RepID=UPI002FC3AC28